MEYIMKQISVDDLIDFLNSYKEIYPEFGKYLVYVQTDEIEGAPYIFIDSDGGQVTISVDDESFRMI